MFTNYEPCLQRNKVQQKIEEKIKGRVFPFHSFCAIKVHLMKWLMQTRTLPCAPGELEWQIRNIPTSAGKINKICTPTTLLRPEGTVFFPSPLWSSGVVTRRNPLYFSDFYEHINAAHVTRTQWVRFLIRSKSCYIDIELEVLGSPLNKSWAHVEHPDCPFLCTFQKTFRILPLDEREANECKQGCYPHWKVWKTIPECLFDHNLLYSIL